MEVKLDTSWRCEECEPVLDLNRLCEECVKIEETIWRLAEPFERAKMELSNAVGQLVRKRQNGHLFTSETHDCSIIYEKLRMAVSDPSITLRRAAVERCVESATTHLRLELTHSPLRAIYYMDFEINDDVFYE